MFLQAVFIAEQHFAGFAAFKRTYYAGGFQLVDDAPCTVIAKLQLALDKRSRALLVHYDQTGCFFKHWVAVLGVKFLCAGVFAFAYIFRQQESAGVAALVADKIGYLFNFRRINKRAL